MAMNKATNQQELTSNESEERQRLFKILLEEYRQWRDGEFANEQEELIALGAFAAIGNVLAKVIIEKSDNLEELRGKK